MKRTTRVLPIESLNQVFDIDAFLATPRNIKWKLVFAEPLQQERASVGAFLQQHLAGFTVGIHLNEPEITIRKLITDREIEDNQLFFEQCAKDYRALAINLMAALSKKLGIEFDQDFPGRTLNSLKQDRTRGQGTIGEWRYYLHGFDCGFENQKTKQCIEASIVHGMEYGVLDPYFFSMYIKSSPQYDPLPVAIYEDYDDGQQIITKMLELGKFELINSNIPNRFTAVVTDREKIAVKVLE
jgi:hypothetical protein